MKISIVAGGFFGLALLVACLVRVWGGDPETAQGVVVDATDTDKFQAMECIDRLLSQECEERWLYAVMACETTRGDIEGKSLVDSLHAIVQQHREFQAYSAQSAQFVEIVHCLLFIAELRGIAELRSAVMLLLTDDKPAPGLPYRDLARTCCRLSASEHDLDEVKTMLRHEWERLSAEHLDDEECYRAMGVVEGIVQECGVCAYGPLQEQIDVILAERLASANARPRGVSSSIFATMDDLRAIDSKWSALSISEKLSSVLPRFVRSCEVIPDDGTQLNNALIRLHGGAVVLSKSAESYWVMRLLRDLIASEPVAVADSIESALLAARENSKSEEVSAFEFLLVRFPELQKKTE